MCEEWTDFEDGLLGGQEYIEGGPTRRADKQGSLAHEWPVRGRLVSAETCSSENFDRFMSLLLLCETVEAGISVSFYVPPSSGETSILSGAYSWPAQRHTVNGNPEAWPKIFQARCTRPFAGSGGLNHSGENEQPWDMRVRSCVCRIV